MAHAEIIAAFDAAGLLKIPALHLQRIDMQVRYKNVAWLD